MASEYDILNIDEVSSEENNEKKADKYEKNLDSLNLICFNRMKENLTIIKDKIINNFNIYNRSFSLKVIIWSPFSGHYLGIITNLEK